MHPGFSPFASAFLWRKVPAGEPGENRDKQGKESLPTPQDVVRLEQQEKIRENYLKTQAAPQIKT